jgi:serine/threonine-protein kinase RsbW
VLRLDSGSAEDLARLHPWLDAAIASVPVAMHYGMRVALDEVVMNIAMHAFPPGGSGEITVRLLVSPDTAVLFVEDSGRAFDPSALPIPLPRLDPGGLGLTLLHHYCRDIVYRREGEQNRLMLRFPLPPA